MIHPFSEFSLHVENVQWAKSYLTKKGIALDDEAYRAIRTILEKTPGWVGLFVRFHYEERVPVDELATLYDELMAQGTALKNLDKPVDQYKGYEKLCDDLELLKSQVKVNAVVQEMPAFLKAQYRELREIYQVMFRSSVVEFSKLPEVVQRQWFRKISSFKNIGALAEDLYAFVAAATSGWDFATVRQAVENTPTAKVVYANEDANILVAQLFDFEASKALNGSTQWCIRNSQSNWDNYVGEYSGNRQFTIYNFNLPASDRHSMVGATINAMGAPTATHLRDDGEMKPPQFKSFIRTLGITKLFGSTNIKLLKDLVPKFLAVKTAGEMVVAIRDFVDGFNNNTPRRESVALSIARCKVIDAVFQGKDARFFADEIGAILANISSYYASGAHPLNAQTAEAYAHTFDVIFNAVMTMYSKTKTPLLLVGAPFPLGKLYAQLTSEHSPATLDFILAKGEPRNERYLIDHITMYAHGKKMAQDASYLASKHFLMDDGAKGTLNLIGDGLYDEAAALLTAHGRQIYARNNYGRYVVLDNLVSYFFHYLNGEALAKFPIEKVSGLHDWFVKNASMGDYHSWYKPSEKQIKKLLVLVEAMIHHDLFVPDMDSFLSDRIFRYGAYSETPGVYGRYHEMMLRHQAKRNEAVVTRFGSFNG